MKGLFISLEGPDGCGKSTQIAFMKSSLESRGYDVIVTREPGGTVISEQIRQVILDKNNMAMQDTTELLLYAAARAQLVGEVIKPAVEAGKVVICDRFVDSSAVYQGIARGLGVDTVYEVNAYALQNMMPDITFFLDMPAAEGIRRKNNQHDLDRMELQKAAFHEKVVEGYRQLAQTQKERIVTIDAMKSIEEIRIEIEERLIPLLKQPK
ncbi:MAG: dTMP kinase [Lachnospiraceae bacterium]|nr:dTMP kinase [Lachnospiraceae bacterium]